MIPHWAAEGRVVHKGPGLNRKVLTAVTAREMSGVSNLSERRSHAIYAIDN